MDEWVYTLTVTNPDPGASSATLSNAFTVTQGIGVWNAGALYGGPVDEVTCQQPRNLILDWPE